MIEDIAKFFFYLALIAVVYLKPRLDAWIRTKRATVGKSAAVIQAVDAKCYFLLGQFGYLGAKRVSVWQFGNGDVSFMGFSFKYTSMVGESHAYEQKSMRNESQKTPIYDYTPILNTLKEHNGVMIYKTKECKGMNLFHLLSSLNIISSIECKLNQQRLDDGFISISFDREISLTPNQIEVVERTAFEIFQILKQK